MPDFKLSIFDLEKGKNLSCSEKIPCPKNIKKLKFNPANSNEFCLLSSETCYFYQIHPAYMIEDKDGEQFLDESERLSKTEYRPENPEIQMQYFVYDQYGRVHITTDMPELIQVDSYTA